MNGDPVNIRDLQPADYHAWLPMWADYCDLPPEAPATHLLWHRLTDIYGPKLGLPEGLVVEVDGKVVGFLHYVRHAHTWGTGLWCHCEDLYVLPEYRRSGAAQALLDFLLKRGMEMGWDAIYGHTDKNNPALFLYNKFASVDDKVTFTLELKG